MRRVLLTASLASLWVCSPMVTLAQIITPLPRNLTPTKDVLVTFWGQAQTQSAGEDANPLNSASAKFIATVHPASRLLVFVAGNKGAGLEQIAADSFELASIAFPEASNSGFLGKIQVNLIDREDGTRIRHQWPVFLDYAWQQRTVDMREDTGTEPAPRSFDVSSFYVGTGYALVKSTANEPFRLLLLASYTSLQVSDKTVPDYRFIGGDETLADKLFGPAIKLALNYNDWGFEFGYVDLKAPHGVEVEGLSGGLFTIGFTAAGRLFDIYKN